MNNGYSYNANMSHGPGSSSGAIAPGMEGSDVILVHDLGYAERAGPRILKMTSEAGNVRHDIMVDKALMGRVIGPKGSTLRSLTSDTQCEIFVLDKEVSRCLGSSYLIFHIVMFDAARRQFTHVSS